MVYLHATTWNNCFCSTVYRSFHTAPGVGQGQDTKSGTGTGLVLALGRMDCITITSAFQRTKEKFIRSNSG